MIPDTIFKYLTVSAQSSRRDGILRRVLIAIIRPDNRRHVDLEFAFARRQIRRRFRDLACEGVKRRALRRKAQREQVALPHGSVTLSLNEATNEPFKSAEPRRPYLAELCNNERAVSLPFFPGMKRLSRRNNAGVAPP